MQSLIQLQGYDNKMTSFTRFVLCQSKVFKRMLEGMKKVFEHINQVKAVNIINFFTLRSKRFKF
jgi:hypothetical protein